jgi:hypothetical protein
MLIAGIVSAQENDRPSVEEMHARKWAFIVENSKLSTKEAARIKPIFMEYEQQLWKITEKNKEFFRDFFRDDANRSEEDYEKMNEMYVNAEMQRTQLLKSYYAKLRKQIPASSIFKYLNAERSFRKQLIDKWQGKHKPEKPKQK